MPNISQETFEAALIEARGIEARGGVANPGAGLFGPSSPMWTVGREAIIFLCAGRDALLQTAHPFVAAAIDQHSNVKTNPRDRFRRTFLNVFDMVFGTQDDALTKARAVRAVHDHIHGDLRHTIGSYVQGQPYSAHDKEAVQWVHATLTASAIDAYEMFHGPMSRTVKDAYWQDSLRFAALFGLRKTDMPESWSAFEAWWQATLTGPLLAVGPEAREICGQLLLGTGSLRALPKWYLALTSGLMPPHLREAYGLSFGPLDRRRAQSAVSRLVRLYPILPGKLKYAPGFHRAQARLQGKPEPDILTRGLERLWLG